MRLLFTLFFLSTLTTLFAQKLDGRWEMVARKGEDPCLVDRIYVFGEKGGPSSAAYGSVTEGCTPRVTNYLSWTVEKEDVKYRSGKVVKVTMIRMKSAEAGADLELVLLEYEDDFMLVTSGVNRNTKSKNQRGTILRRMDN